MFIAGGTDVMVMIKKKEVSPTVLISLNRIRGLDQIEYDGTLRIGAMVTHRTIEKSGLIREKYSALSDAVQILGSVQIRNVATIGGNICSAAPSADTATPLLVLGAQVKVKSLMGEKVVPLEDFFRGPGENVLREGEIVTELMIPKLLPNTGSAYWKHQRRLALDLPIVGVSVLLSLDKNRLSRPEMLCTSIPISSVFQAIEENALICKEAKIALGVAAPIPMRAVKAENILRDQKISDKLIEETAYTASEEAQPRDSIRGEAWYRREMIRVFVKRMAMKCIERIVAPKNTPFPA